MIKKIIIAASIALVIIGLSIGFYCYFNYQIVRVPSGSMANTILAGEVIVARKDVGEIKRGDLIVFKFPQDPSVQYIKRVIGMPGESVEVKGQRVFINGNELPEQRISVSMSNNIGDPLIIDKKQNSLPDARYNVYLTESEDADFDSILRGQKFAVGKPLAIEPNHYFVMGDDRDNSQDSRYWGTVPREMIVSKPFMIYSSRYKDPSGNERSRDDRVFSKIQ
jgi:signal peptidase I